MKLKNICRNMIKLVSFTLLMSCLVACGKKNATATPPDEAVIDREQVEVIEEKQEPVEVIEEKQEPVEVIEEKQEEHIDGISVEWVKTSEGGMTTSLLELTVNGRYQGKGVSYLIYTGDELQDISGSAVLDIHLGEDVTKEGNEKIYLNFDEAFEIDSVTFTVMEPMMSGEGAFLSVYEPAISVFDEKTGEFTSQDISEEDVFGERYPTGAADYTIIVK